jgi:hypothetical protein
LCGVRIGSGRNQATAAIRVPADHGRPWHAGFRRLPQTRSVDLKPDAALDHRIEDRRQALSVAGRIVVAMRFRRIPLRQVEVTDRVEPPGLDGSLYLCQVRQEHVVQRTRGEVVWEDHRAIGRVVHRSDHEVEFVPVLGNESTHLICGSLVEVDLRPAQDRQFPAELVADAVDLA